jgi:hypothetical protein
LRRRIAQAFLMSKRVFARSCSPYFWPSFSASHRPRAVLQSKKNPPQIAADYRTFFSRKEIML